MKGVSVYLGRVAVRACAAHKKAGLDRIFSLVAEHGGSLSLADLKRVYDEVPFLKSSIGSLRKALVEIDGISINSCKKVSVLGIPKRFRHKRLQGYGCKTSARHDGRTHARYISNHLASYDKLVKSAPLPRGSQLAEVRRRSATGSGLGSISEWDAQDAIMQQTRTLHLRLERGHLPGGMNSGSSSSSVCPIALSNAPSINAERAASPEKKKPKIECI